MIDTGNDASATLAEKYRATAVKRRHGYRLVISNEVKTLQKDIRDNVSDADLKCGIGKLRTFIQKLEGVDAEVLVTTPEEKQDEVILEALEYLSGVEGVIQDADILVQSRKASAAPSGGTGDQGQETTGMSIVPTVKLPTLEIQPYDGDPLAWREFWDSFTSTIHDNKNLSPVEKFKYLQQYLQGEALTLAEGYPLCNDTYDLVVRALRERFGDDELAKLEHLKKLIGLPKATNDIESIQRTSDACEMHIRCHILCSFNFYVHF